MEDVTVVHHQTEAHLCLLLISQRRQDGKVPLKFGGLGVALVADKDGRVEHGDVGVWTAHLRGQQHRGGHRHVEA